MLATRHDRKFNLFLLFLLSEAYERVSMTQLFLDHNEEA